MRKSYKLLCVRIKAKTKLESVTQRFIELIHFLSRIYEVITVFNVESCGNFDLKIREMSYIELALLAIFGCFLLTIVYNFTKACLEHKHQMKIQWAG